MPKKRTKKTKAELKCSFCEAPQSQCDLLIYTDNDGPSICDDCVGVAVQVIEEHERKKEGAH